MSYEISNVNNEPISPGKYSKIDNEDCELLLQETSLDDDNEVISRGKNAESRVPKQSPAREVLEQFDPIQTQKGDTKPKGENIQLVKEKQPPAPVTKQSIPQQSSSKGDPPRKTTTPKSTSHRSFDLSLSSFIRFLSFRKKKPKPTESGSTSQDNSTDSPSRKRKDDRGSQSSRAERDDNERPSMLHRFVRTFSFLYKRNPAPKFTRSPSMPNYPTTKRAPAGSLPNIKYPVRQVNSPTSSAPSSSSPRRNTGGSVKNSRAPPDPQPKRDRAKSDIPILNKAKENHVKDSEPKATEPVVIRSTSPTETDSNTSRPIDLKQELIRKEMAKEAASTVIIPKTKSTHLVTVETLPAVCGIQNHGNTCFINSVIQCLSNTDLLAEYFVFDHYREDLLRPKFANKKYGTRGELTEHFAILLKSLWSCMYSSEISMKFKKTVSKFGDQYNGYEQHDAQEFLLWLLDKCHEDLTVPSSKGANKNAFMPFKKGFNKRPRKPSNDQLVTDEAAAIESLAKYQTVNSNSIIYDLFQGQLRSMVVCRNCEHYSKTFDPYLCLSLPVPIRLTLTIFIQANFLEKERSSGMYGISIEAAATLRELRDKISRMLKIPEKRLILLHIDKKDGMIEFANDANMIQEVFEDFETIHALETPAIPETESTQLIAIDTEESAQNELSGMCQQMLTIVWLNRVGIDKEGTIFGPLFTALVSRECTFKKLQSKILSTMSDYLIDSENVDCDDISRSINLRIRVVSGLPGKEYLSPEVDHPLFVPTVEHALSKTEDKRIYRGPYHLKIMVEWDLDVRRSILVNDDLIDAIHEKNSFIDKSVEIAKERSNMNNRTTLQDCLDIYFREESLTADNAWMCPSCNSRQQCVKQLSVWTLPNIFIMHLKRFRYMSNVRRIKINTMVEYPQNGLDMLKYVAQRKFNSTNDSTNNVNSQVPNGINNCSKFSNKRKLQNIIEETTFNLYGVVCHHGTMQGGHYTAYCKNPVDNCWYLFDDTKVIPVLEEAVVTADAYLLFYQKSSLSTVNVETKANQSTSSISSGYLSSVTCSSLNTNHWSNQMPPFNYFSNGNDRNHIERSSNTLPNRKVIQPNKAIGTGNSANGKPININPRAANYEATKHSNTNHIQQNGGKKPDQAAAPNKSYSASNNHYNNTFPRVKVRQASH